MVGFASDGWFSFSATPGYTSYGNDPGHITWFEPASATPGKGFWAYFGASGGNSPRGMIPDQTQPKTITLKSGWNLIGNPFIKPVAWDRSAITVKDGAGVTRTLSQSNAIVADYAWGWDSVAGSYYLVYDPLVIPGSRGSLDPWLGCWIKALADCDLVIPAP